MNKDLLKKESEKSNIPFEKMGRQLVWHDEFDKNEIDFSKWHFIRAMWSPDVEYDNTERCARIEDGKLHLQIHKSEKEGMVVILPDSFTTKDFMNFKYGYLEMCCKIPYRHGAWPGFWMKSDTPFAKAPYMSEIDIFEVFSSNCMAVCNLHKWQGLNHTLLPDGEGSPKRGYVFEDCSNLNNEYHVYGFEWTEEYTAFYIDGKKYAQFSIKEEDDFSPEYLPGMSCFKDFHYILLNNELFTSGKDWHPQGAVITEEDELPIDYWVDWIRLYQNPEKEEIVFSEDIKAALE